MGAGTGDFSDSEASDTSKEASDTSNTGKGVLQPHFLLLCGGFPYK